MTMPFYVSPEQQFKDKADYARKGISKGSPLVVAEYNKGIVFVAVNPSTHLQKVGELYDRIAFAGVGRFSEFEQLRQAGVRMADVKGYTTSREDVSARAITNAYSQALNQVFQEQPKAFEVELCVAELGEGDRPNAIYHVSFDGTMVDCKGFLAIGGQADALSAAVKTGFKEGWDLDTALRSAVNALRTVTPQSNGEQTRLEVAVLERGQGRRTFRRLTQEEVRERLNEGDEKPAEEKPAEEKPAEEKPAEEKPAEEKTADEKPADEKPADEKPADGKASGAREARSNGKGNSGKGDRGQPDG
jgi:proteasome alpha subunit